MCTSSTSCTAIANPTYKQDSSMTGYNGTTYGNGSVKMTKYYVVNNIYKADGSTTGSYGGHEVANTYTYSYGNVIFQAYEGIYGGPVYDSIKEYKKIVTNASAVRLVYKEELETLGCTFASGSDSCSGSPAWLHSTSYWTGVEYRASDSSGYSAEGIGFKIDGSIAPVSSHTVENTYGVRPVIEIQA